MSEFDFYRNYRRARGDGAQQGGGQQQIGPLAGEDQDGPNKLRGPTPFWHWLTVQIMQYSFSVGLLVLISIFLSPRAILKIMEVLYYAPLLAIVSLLMYCMCWRSRTNCEGVLVFLSIGSWFLFAIFVMRFFNEYYEAISTSLEPVRQCQVLHREELNVGGVERYSMLKVRFENQHGVFRYGYGCVSNQSLIAISDSEVDPAKYYVHGEEMPCNQSQIVYRDDGSPVRQSESGKPCETLYDKSQVKLASWSCLSDDYPVDLGENRDDCNYRVYGDEKLADINGEDPNFNPRDVHDFYHIVFSEEMYYDKDGFRNLIFVFLLPFMVFCVQSCVLQQAHNLTDSVRNCCSSKKDDENQGANNQSSSQQPGGADNSVYVPLQAMGPSQRQDRKIF